jgi:hypothetical protein
MKEYILAERREERGGSGKRTEERKAGEGRAKGEGNGWIDE